MTEQATETELKGTTVTRVVSKPLKSVWAALMAPNGVEALLGPGGRIGDKGERWESGDGTFGVTRSFHPMEQIRFSWHKEEGAPRTLVDFHLTAQGDDETKLVIEHDFADADLDVDAMEQKWSEALERVEAEVA